MEFTTYYIAFYKFLDTQTWQRTGLFPNMEGIVAYTDAIPYVNKDSLVIKPIELPNVINVKSVDIETNIGD